MILTPSHLLTLLAEASPDILDRKPKSGKWSVRETVAHFARYQVVFLERMRRAVAEDEPDLGRPTSGDLDMYISVIGEPSTPLTNLRNR